MKTIDKTKKFEGANADLGEAFKALKLVIARDIIPIVTKVVTWVAKGVAAFKNFIKGTELVKVALVALGAAATVFAVQMAIANAPIILMGALFAGLILVVEDLIALFTGDENSQIGEWIDKVFGKGASDETVRQIKNAWQGVKDVFSSMAPVVQKIWDLFKYAIDHSDQIATIVQGWLPPVAIARGIAKATYATGEFIGGLGGELSQAQSPQLTKKAREKSGVSVDPNSSLASFYDAPKVASYSSDAAPVTINQTINAAPGMDEKKLGKHVANHVAKVIKRHTRDADAGRPRSSSP